MKNELKWKSIILCSLLCGIHALAWAAPSDIRADIASRQQNREAELRGYYEAKRQAARPTPSEVKVQAKQQEQQQEKLSFYVSEIRVTQSQILTVEEIKAAVQFAGAGEMTVEQLQEIVARLNKLYQQKGRSTSQAVLPPQVIKDGIVYIRLIEGRYGEIKVSGNKRITDNYIKQRIKAQRGELSDLQQLQRDLILYNNTNSYRLRAELKPGQQVGSSDLELALEEPENPWSSYFFVDNANQDDSGLYRFGYVAELRGLSGSEDRLVLNPVWTRGTLSGYVAYEAPISDQGTKATFYYSRNRVKIIDGALEDYNIRAHSNDLSAGISHPLNVTALTKTDFFVEAHQKWSDTDYMGFSIADNATKSIKAGLNIRSYDKNGLWFAQLSATGFRSEYKVSDMESSGTYYGAYLLRRQALPHEQGLLLRAYGQLTSVKELPSSEQFSIGGMATVRGYDESALSGDKGWYASMEYSFPVLKKAGLRGFAFYDHGVAYNNYATETQRTYLSSTGLGLELAYAGWYGKLALGVPLAESSMVKHSKTRTHFYLQKNI